jgi:hypothetical protein
LRLVPTFYLPAQCTVVGAGSPHYSGSRNSCCSMDIDLGHSSSPHLGHAFALALPLPLLQHASEPHCIVLALVTALDPLAALSLPHAVAQYRAIDTSAVVNGIGHFTWQFPLIQKVIMHLNHTGSNSHYYRIFYFIFTMRGDPADPLTAARSFRDFETWV